MQHASKCEGPASALGFGWSPGGAQGNALPTPLRALLRCRFYYNRVTKESTRHKPVMLSWVKKANEGAAEL